VPYSFTLTATGGFTPYTWTSIGALPPGLALSSSGVISGIPTALGTFTLTVQVSDSSTPAQTQIRSFSLAVTGALSITTSQLPNGAVNKPYSQNLQATGGTPPYAWAVTSGSPPSGLTLSQQGTLSGTPTNEGAFSFTVSVNDSSATSQTATRTVSIT